MPNPPTPVATLIYTVSVDASAQPVFVFNGSASITDASLQFPQPGATIVFWINATAANANGVLLTYGGDPSNNAESLWLKNPGNLLVGVGSVSSVATGINCADGFWHQVAVTLSRADANTIAVGIYVDGVLTWYSPNAIYSASGITIETTAALVLGQGFTGNPSLTAQISEFQLWPKVLSAEAVMTGLQVRAATGGGAVLVWALTSAATSGTIQGGSFATSNPALLFRSNRTLTARWTVTNPPAGTTYNLQAASSDNRYHTPQNGITSTSATIPGVQINVAYAVQVQSVVSGTAGIWSQPATATTLDLGQAQPAFTPAAAPFLITWPTIDQTQLYQLTFLQNGSTQVPPSGTQAGNSVDVTTLIEDLAHTYTFNIAATAMGSISPPSAAQAVTQPQVTFEFTNTSTTAGTLVVSWTNTDGAAERYLQVIKLTGGPTTIVSSVLDGATLSDTVAITPQEGDSYTAQVRPLAPGNIGPWSALVPVTIHFLNGPVIGAITVNAPANSMTVRWTYQPPQGVTVSYELELWNSAKTQRITLVSAAVSPQVVTNAAIVDDASLNLRVRAVANNSNGLWSQWVAVTVGGVPKVLDVNALVNITGDITVNWLSVLAQNPALQGVSYTVQLTGSNISPYSVTTMSLTATLLQANSHVQPNTTYTVIVTASAQGKPNGDPSDPCLVTVGTITPWPPGQSGTSSDPINLAFGAFLYQNDDLAVNGVVPLVFTTQYNSSRPTSAQNPIYSNVLGDRWSHTYSTALRRDPQGGYIYLVWGLAGVERYQIPTSVTGAYANAGAAPGSTLVLGSNMVFTLTRADQTVYTFDYNGNLTGIKDAYGNQATVGYDGQQRLSTITDVQSNFTLTVTYGQSTLSVTDGTRTVTYTISGGNLTQFTDARGHNRTFNYVPGQTALIETIVDFNGLTSIRNTYTNGQVTFQQDARALATPASYGTTLGYTATTVGDSVAGVTTAMTDRMGNQSTYTSVAASGNLLAEVYHVDATNIYALNRTYDGFNNLLTNTEYQGPAAGYSAGMGNTTTLTYDSSGNLSTAIMPLGAGRVAALSRTYDASNNLLTEAYYEGPQQGYVAGMGNVTTWTYNSDNTMATMKPPLGAAVGYTSYKPGNIHGLLQNMTDVLGNGWSFTYYGTGLVQTATDPYGNVTTYTWDPLGRLQQKQVAGADGVVLRTAIYGYNQNNQVTSVTLWFNGQTQAQAFVTQAVYDNNGNLYTLTDATNVMVTYHCDPNNNRISAMWPAFQQITRTTGWGYDKNDFLNSTTLSVSNPAVSASYVCDALGFRTQRTDPMGYVYNYNSAMQVQPNPPYPQVKTKTWPALPVTGTANESKTYDALGRRISSTDRNGNVTTVAWGMQTDAATHTLQQVLTVTLPPVAPQQPSFTRQTVIDALGRPLQFTDGSGKSWNWTYQVAAGPGGKNVQVATCTDPDGNQGIISTDSFGRIVIEKLGSGTTWQERQYSYDALGRITQVIESDGTSANTATTQYAYSYDVASGCFAVTIGRTGQGDLTTGVTIQYYNGRGDLVKQSNPYGQSEQQSYAPWGSLAGYVNGRSQSFTYGFDPAGRRNSVTQPGNVLMNYGLDNNGNRLTTQVGAGPGITCTFDHWNRLSSRTDASGRAVSYQYWPNDQLKTLTYPDGKNAGYVYDGLSRLSTVTDWAQRQTIYSYSPTGLITGIAFQGPSAAAIASSTFTFDNAGRATGYTHNAQGLVLAQLAYQLDPLGQPQTATVVLPLPTTLPAATTFTYGSGNQIATINAVNQATDNDGNFLGPSGAAPILVYDAYGRVTGYNADTYTYDLDGLRTGSTVAGVAQSYVFDVNAWQSPQVERGDPVRAVIAAGDANTPNGANSWLPVYSGSQVPIPMQLASDRLLMVYDSSGNVVARFVHGMGLIGGEDSTGYYSVALTDFTGNVLVQVGSDGAITNRYAYDAYGASLGKNVTAFNPFGYNGRDGVLDDGNGLLYMRARSYMPAQLRFLQPDYLVGSPYEPQTLNRYTFAMGNPVQGNDPLGLAKLALGLTALGGLILTALGFAAYQGLLGAGPAAFMEGALARIGLGRGAGTGLGGEIEMEPLVQGVGEGVGEGLGEGIGEGIGEGVGGEVVADDVPLLPGRGMQASSELLQSRNAAEAGSYFWRFKNWLKFGKLS